MTPERFRQIRNLFDAVLERDAASRNSFLSEACQGDEPLRTEIERLLAAHQQRASLLDRLVARPELLTGEPGRMEGRRVDHYEILRELGHGGMGSVYLAARTDDVYRKPVALKVVRPESSTPETIARFRREREILASLDHPNIARLLDGGTTPEGLPYFVMDFVEGRPIDIYCDEHELTVADRMRLYRSVCAAVEYAHQRGLVHRDLKPGNILVTADGVPKLLDFGIAKLLRSESESEETATFVTRAGLRLMTPEYASPEQVRGEMVGPASDIYSLGVILYELLTGHRPYRLRSRLIHEVMRVICEEEPTRPSTAVTESEPRLVLGEEKPVMVTPQIICRSRETTPSELRRELSGDVDNILLRTLRKNPQERYASAKDLSDDLQHRLDGQPVSAQSQSLIYQAGKLLRKHQGWAIAAAVLVVGIATGTVRISSDAVKVLAGFVITLAAAFLLLRKELGEGTTRYLLRRWGLILAGFVAAGLLAYGLATAIPYQSDPRVMMRWLLPVLLLVTLLVAERWARWIWRERFAGPLLSNLSVPRHWVAYAWLAFMGILFVTLGIAAVARRNHLPLLMFEALIAAMLFLVTYVFAMYGKMEIRRRGVLYGGYLIPWRRIAGHTWEQREGRFAILKLRSHPPFLPRLVVTQDIIVSSDRRPEVEAVLRRQLSEWPAS